MGQQIDVTGTLAAYFSRPGLTGSTAFALSGGGTPPGGGGGPYDDTYYADAIGKTGSQLEATLHDIISTGDTPVSYDTVWTALKATDQDPANSARGNLDFDEGGTQNAEAPGNYADGDSWEPRDAVKGDVARMIFYMSVRYEGGDGWADLEVNDLVGNGSRPHIGRVSVLLRWNVQDPPDTFEKRRNDVIHSTWQHNRNPFVDHPEWADAIW